MEPLTALSLTSNVIQLVDFSCKLFSKSRSIYASASGSDEEYNEVELVTKDLQRLTKELQDSLAAASGAPASRHEQPLFELSKSCKTVAEELLEALSSIRSSGKQTRFKSILKALESIWRREEIEERMKRLSNIRDELNIRVLFELRAHFDEFSPQVAANFDALAQDTKSIIYALLQQRASVTASFQDQFVKATELQQKTSQEISEANDKLRNDILGMLAGWANTSPAYRQPLPSIMGKDISIEEGILRSLRFETMLHRFDEIKSLNRRKKTYEKAYEWLDLSSSVQNSSQCALGPWLRNGQGVFWIAGKAASGKSTLMKFLDQDPQVHELLGRWALGSPLLIATYYFWNSGDVLQKSSVGLLRSLLFAILNERRELIPVVFPQRWFEYGCQLKIPDDSWTLKELTEALHLLLTQKVLPSKFCFFIDGLDEFEGDYSGIIKLLKKIPESSGIKLCLSSRPLVDFERAFGNGPKIMLQDFTRPEIQSYVTHKLGDNPDMMNLKRHKPQETQELIDSIVTLAAGVFLWVRLVVRSLLEGLKNSDSIADLKAELDRLPTELEDLFSHMLQKVPSRYHLQSWTYLQIVRLATFVISPLMLSFADDPLDFVLGPGPNKILSQEYSFRVDGIDRRLKSRCLGLLEIRGHAGSRSKTVTFIHKSVVDFLSNSKEGTILAHPPHISQIHLQIMKLALADIKFDRGKDFVKLSAFLRHAAIYEQLSGTFDIAMMLDAQREHAKVCDDNAITTSTQELQDPYRLNYHLAAPEPFLALAIQSGLALYVAHRLQTAPRKPTKSKRPFLFYAIISPPPNTTLQTWKSFQSNPDLVLTLLNVAAADPNQVYNGSSPWTQALANAFASLNKRPLPETPVPEDTIALEAKNWLRVFRHFIDHGADPFAFCESPYIFDRDGAPAVATEKKICSLQTLVRQLARYDSVLANEFEVVLKGKQRDWEVDLAERSTGRKRLEREDKVNGKVVSVSSKSHWLGGLKSFRSKS